MRHIQCAEILCGHLYGSACDASVLSLPLLSAQWVLLVVISSWGRTSAVYLILSVSCFFGPLEGENLLKQVMSISHGLKIISLKLVLLDALQIMWHSWI